MNRRTITRLLAFTPFGVLFGLKGAAVLSSAPAKKKLPPGILKIGKAYRNERGQFCIQGWYIDCSKLPLSDAGLLSGIWSRSSEGYFCGYSYSQLEALDQNRHLYKENTSA